MKKYCIEIVTFFLGAIASVLQLIFLKDFNLSVMLFSITVVVTVAAIGINKAINELKNKNDVFGKINLIENPKWIQISRTKVFELLKEIDEMSLGKRRINQNELLFDEVELIRSSKKKLYAIHVVDNFESLNMLLSNNVQNEMHNINKTYSELGKRVDKKRVILMRHNELNNSDFKAIIKTLQDDKVIGLFENRVIFIESLDAYQIPKPLDAVINENEALTIEHNHNVILAHNYISQKDIYKLTSEFLTLWKVAKPLKEVL